MNLKCLNQCSFGFFGQCITRGVRQTAIIQENVDPTNTRYSYHPGYMDLICPSFKVERSCLHTMIPVTDWIDHFFTLERDHHLRHHEPNVHHFLNRTSGCILYVITIMPWSSMLYQLMECCMVDRTCRRSQQVPFLYVYCTIGAFVRRLIYPTSCIGVINMSWLGLS